MTTDDPNGMLTYAEACAFLGGGKPYTPTTLRRWVREGRLRAIRLSARAVRFRKTDLEAFVTRAGTGAGPAARDREDSPPFIAG